jgi:hypothetical protein
VGSLEDRVRKLEAAHGAGREADEAERRRRRTMDRVYHAIESGRRELAALDPLPTPPELAETKDDILHTLRHVIPHYRARGGYSHGDGAEFLREWEDCTLEKLAELQEGAEE